MGERESEDISMVASMEPLYDDEQLDLTRDPIIHSDNDEKASLEKICQENHKPVKLEGEEITVYDEGLGKGEKLKGYYGRETVGVTLIPGENANGASGSRRIFVPSEGRYKGEVLNPICMVPFEEYQQKIKEQNSSKIVDDVAKSEKLEDLLPDEKDISEKYNDRHKKIVDSVVPDKIHTVKSNPLRRDNKPVSEIEVEEVTTFEENKKKVYNDNDEIFNSIEPDYNHDDISYEHKDVIDQKFEETKKYNIESKVEKTFEGNKRSIEPKYSKKNIEEKIEKTFDEKKSKPKKEKKPSLIYKTLKGAINVADKLIINRYTFRLAVLTAGFLGAYALSDIVVDGYVSTKQKVVDTYETVSEKVGLGIDAVVDEYTFQKELLFSEDLREDIVKKYISIYDDVVETVFGESSDRKVEVDIENITKNESIKSTPKKQDKVYSITVKSGDRFYNLLVNELGTRDSIIYKNGKLRKLSDINLPNGTNAQEAWNTYNPGKDVNKLKVGQVIKFQDYNNDKKVTFEVK